MFVLELGSDGRSGGRVAQPALKQEIRTGFPVGDLFAGKQVDQALACVVISATGLGEERGARAGDAVHAVAIPLLRGFERPVGGLILMAFVAGIRDAELLREQGIGYCVAVVVPPMPLHVDGLRHVAVDALVARAVGAMKTVRLGQDDRCVGEAALGVAAHAELIAGQDRFHAVHVVAVHAAHARMVHAAAEEGGELVVLIADLPVGIVDVRVIDDGQQVVVPKGIARLEVACDFAAARMATGAVLRVLVARPAGKGRVFVVGLACGRRILLLPIDVRFHRTVAGLAAHGEFRHRRVVGVGLEIVVFADPGIVAARAHLVPDHSAPGPVAPFAGHAILVAIDVEPFLRVRIPAGFHRVETSALAVHEELTQRIVTDDAFDRIRLALVVEAE